MKRFALMLLVLFVTAGIANAKTANFEDLILELDSYWNGSDGTREFISGGVQFNIINDVNGIYGFSYSNMTDTELSGYGDARFIAITGMGVNNSDTYAVASYCIPNDYYVADPPTITLEKEQVVSGAYFTNNNFAYYSMLLGDGFAKKFDSTDWFMITITGHDAEGNQKAEKIEVFLAQNSNILDTWQWVDLKGLGAVKKITFSMSSSDTGEWGMNTPAYFAIDDFNGKKPGSDDGGSDSSTCFINTMGSHFFSGTR